MTSDKFQHDDIRFDRLVDGELPPDEYRGLLASLDDEPGGWRRCALAFLEAQGWRDEMHALRDETCAPPPAQVQTRGSRNNFFTMSLAMAAGFLLAFGLGVAVRTMWPGDAQAPPRGQIANVSGEQDAGSRDDGPADEQPPRESAVAVDSPQREPLENVTLVIGGEGPDPRRFEIPVFSYADGGEEYLRTDRSALPAAMRELLERNGHRLRRAQTLVPLQLEDGQQIVVPVEEVEIVPAGLPPF